MHTSTLQTVLNLGLLYRYGGKLTRAEDMYARVLAGFEKALGLEHEHTGRVRRAIGDLTETPEPKAFRRDINRLFGKNKSMMIPIHASDVSGSCAARSELRDTICPVPPKLHLKVESAARHPIMKTGASFQGKRIKNSSCNVERTVDYDGKDWYRIFPYWLIFLLGAFRLGGGFEVYSMKHLTGAIGERPFLLRVSFFWSTNQPIGPKEREIVFSSRENLPSCLVMVVVLKQNSEIVIYIKKNPCWEGVTHLLYQIQFVSTRTPTFYILFVCIRRDPRIGYWTRY